MNPVRGNAAGFEIGRVTAGRDAAGGVPAPVARHGSSRDESRATVLILCPGGLESGGGIGRQMGYFLAAHAKVSPLSRRYEILDTRGPFYLGSSPLRFGTALKCFARSLLHLARLRAQGCHPLLHVNITGRGSTIRKLMFTRAATMLGLNYLLHVHDPDYGAEFARLPRVVQGLVKHAFRRAKTVLVLGEGDRARLSADLALPANHVRVLANAVPDPLPSATMPERGRGACHLIFLGHLSERKGVPELLQALACDEMRERPWRATFAGGGDVDVYRALALSLGLERRVRFSGWLDADQVAALYADGDVLVLPSRAEGLAMTILEGLAHGIAVVATPVGAHREVIDPGRSGIFVKPGDVDDLAAALVRLVDAPAERARLGAGGRQRYLEWFTIDGYATRLTKIHDELLHHA